MTTMIQKVPARREAQLEGETRILIPGMTFDQYATFVTWLPEGSHLRVAFDGKDMELMVTGPKHDEFAELLDTFLKAVAGELGVRYNGRAAQDALICRPGWRRNNPPCCPDRSCAMPELRLHNSLTRQKERFIPLDPRMCASTSAGRRSMTWHISATRGRWWCSTCWPACCAGSSRGSPMSATSPTWTTRSTLAPPKPANRSARITARTTTDTTRTWRRWGRCRPISSRAPPPISPR